MKQAILTKRTICTLATLSALLAACGAAPAEQPVAAPKDAVVTIRVADAEEYRIRLTDAIATARKLLAGEAAPNIPNGRVVRGEPDVNVGYSWHIDPGEANICSIMYD